VPVLAPVLVLALVRLACRVHRSAVLAQVWVAKGLVHHKL